MSDATINVDLAGASSPRPHLDERPHFAGAIAFLLVLLGGLAYAAFSISNDIDLAGEHALAVSAFVLLAISLLIALGFEFVNGFHDTANAVATVIYTHSLPPLVAVVWSGTFNFLGVLTSSGAVAFTIVTLLPVELILQVGSSAGYDMIFALLIAAIIWNLGTWAMGLPNSSSHALVGSIIGVGVANQLLAPNGVATSGVDWNQAVGVFKALLFSPVLGFVLSALLLLGMKVVVPSKALYTAPEGKKPPPGPIRALLVLTCTGVSFFHGSNDGQKGMGLIMLILIGVAPTAYALNRAMPESTTPAFLQTMQAAQSVFQAHAGSSTPPATAATARATVGEVLKTREVNKPEVYAALATLTGDIGQQVKDYGAIKAVPAAATSNVRNDMYLASDAVRLMGANPAGFNSADMANSEVAAKRVGRRHQVHPDLGEGVGRAGARAGDDGRLETDRGDGGREDRQDSPYLRSRRLRRDRRDGDDRAGGCLWAAGVHHPRSVERRCGHDAGQRVGAAVEHAQEHGDGLGADAARGNDDRGGPLRYLSSDFLRKE